jgi:hypothetical protein
MRRCHCNEMRAECRLVAKTTIFLTIRATVSSSSETMLFRVSEWSVTVLEAGWLIRYRDWLLGGRQGFDSAPHSVPLMEPAHTLPMHWLQAALSPRIK